MTELSSEARNVNWLLANFVRDTLGAREALAVSSDGFLLAASAGKTRAGVEQLAAIVCGLTSLTRGAAEMFSLDEVEQVVVEMGRGFLFVTSISDGSSLGVLTAKNCDIGLIGYEMTLLSERVGTALTPVLLAELKNAISV